MGENYKVKLCDLGLATVMDSFRKRKTVVGTNEWMAPEIGLQESYDTKVDVFSFGIVMTELILCKPPAKRNISNMLKFDEEGFLKEVPSDCPPAFSNLVIQCTQFEPSKRPDFKGN